MSTHRITLHRDYGIREAIEMIPGQINQVFMNLLQNAIHAIPGKGDKIGRASCRERV